MAARWIAWRVCCFLRSRSPVVIGPDDSGVRCKMHWLQQGDRRLPTRIIAAMRPFNVFAPAFTHDDQRDNLIVRRESAVGYWARES